MSMTREEAIKYAESKKVMLEALIYNDDCKYGNYAMYSTELSFVNAALAALRPVSQEQVEKVFPCCDLCSSGKLDWAGFRDRIYLCGGNNIPPENERFRFCPKCGKPMTMERLEATHGQNDA